ncbi:MAG: SDR family oxidoreductase [Bacteroidales bacterium]|nr:SDR family oxidoreductase [Bacteroidales bacterium]
MKILLTGATGYIGRRLLPALLEKGHEVVCCVRDRNRFDISMYPKEKVSIVEVNFLDADTLASLPDDIDAAYYLIHSMSASTGDFSALEAASAENFKNRIAATHAKQLIYLSGISNDVTLSKHLKSRRQVEDILAAGPVPLTTLRAGIIVGSGSASFEIIRDLVEKLPLMIAPRWLNTKTQPIGVRNVIEFLTGVLHNSNAIPGAFDIGGPEVLTYKEMLLKFARIRGLKRKITVVPVMTPRLSSYWLYFVTSTSYKLAVNLVNSMKVEVICRENDLEKKLNIRLIPYEDAVKQAFDKIEQQGVLSSWTDALSDHGLEKGVSGLIEVPVFGCFHDRKVVDVADEEKTLNKIWSIGGKTGWYYAGWLWGIRGLLDKMAGGVGLRRGRKNKNEISAGDSLDFWRVLYAVKEEKRLLLYAEMKLPGEAWLEFRVRDKKLYQTATFRPLGLWGRIYWYLLLPFHLFIFRGMAKRIAQP